MIQWQSKNLLRNVMKRLISDFIDKNTGYISWKNASTRYYYKKDKSGEFKEII